MKATQQLTLSPIGVVDSGYFLLDYSSTNTADADTPSLSLHDVDGLRVRNSRHNSHPRRFVFGKFVRKPNCSWSEPFVNRDLTVLLCSLLRRLITSTRMSRVVGRLNP